MNALGLWPLFRAAERALQRPGVNLPRQAPYTWAWLCEVVHHLETMWQGDLTELTDDPEHWRRAAQVALTMACSPSNLPPDRAGRIVAEHEQYPIEALRERLPVNAAGLPLGGHMRVLVEEMGRTTLEALAELLRPAS